MWARILASVWILALAGPVCAAPRAALTFEDLSGGGLAAPVNLEAFAPPPDATQADGRFEGRLRLDVAQARLGVRIIKDTTGDAPAVVAARATLPPFDFAFVQEGATLIPLQRGPVVSGHAQWDWVLETGRVWREAGDRGWLRAAIPFALQERNANCLHNGVLSFVFRPDGAISNVALEIASETCAYLKFDAWAQVGARYVPETAKEAAATVAAWRRNEAARLPVRPIADLAKLYLGVDPGRFRPASSDDDPPSAYGIVVDGVRYAGPCRTRHGDYPFCEALSLPSYSTAKSIVGAVGLMRLEALHPGTAAGLIRDQVPACSGQAWVGVTLLNAADMATGLYDKTAPQADEDAPAILSFFNAEDHAAKLAYACGHYRRQAEPGTHFAYHTTDTYLLGTALADGLRGDLYADVIAPLWRSLSLSPSILETRRTYDAVRQPFTGWGLTYQADDIVRVGAWVAGGGGGLLDKGLLDSALQRDPAHPGLEAAGKDYRYKTGFWARNLAKTLKCKAPLWVPFMSGYGGISVVLLPGGMTYYGFGDSEAFDWSSAAVEANKIKGLCP
jgi:hypothetical protein